MTTTGKPSESIRAMTAEEIETSARLDPDARPLTDHELLHMKRTPRVKIVRRALDLSQEEFASRYAIPLSMLRDWEQGRSEPDQLARAYLKAIASDPDGVRQALRAPIPADV